MTPFRVNAIDEWLMWPFRKTMAQRVYFLYLMPRSRRRHRTLSQLGHSGRHLSQLSLSIFQRNQYLA